MNRAVVSLALLLSLSLLAGCQKAEEAPAAPTVLTAPTGSDDMAWKEYLGKVVGQNQAGVTDRTFPYYLPVNSSAPAEGDQDGKSQYDRQLENVTAVVQRTVLPGNMLAFGSPASARMADMIVEAFTDIPAGSMKDVRVLFIGQTADSDRVKAAIEPSSANYVFVEAK